MKFIQDENSNKNPILRRIGNYDENLVSLVIDDEYLNQKNHLNEPTVVPSEKEWRPMCNYLFNNHYIKTLHCIGITPAISELLEFQMMLKMNTAITEFNIYKISPGVINFIVNGLIRNSTVTSLEVSDTEMGNKGMLSIQDLLAKNSILTSLTLDKNNITELPPNILKYNSVLRELRLKRDKIGNKGVKIISDYLRFNSSLTYLELFKNEITELPQGFMRDNSTLTVLDLGNNKLERLPQNLLINNSTLTTLYLGFNKLEVLPSNFLAYNSTLTVLDLSNNQLRRLPQSLLTNNSTLTTLNLNSNKLGDQGAINIAFFLQSNTTLTELMLRNNRITNKGVIRLSDSLQYYNTTLNILNLECNYINDLGALPILHALEDNKNVTIFIGYNQIINSQLSQLISKSYDRHEDYFRDI